MEKTQGITYRFADIGHWLARCNHDTKVIELNATEYPKLSPLCRDYIWIHEYVHLLKGVRNEATCNEITDKIFLSRASSESDKEARIRFLENSNPMPSSTITVKTQSTKKTSAKLPDAMALAIAFTIILLTIKNRI